MSQTFQPSNALQEAPGWDRPNVNLRQQDQLSATPKRQGVEQCHCFFTDPEEPYRHGFNLAHSPESFCQGACTFVPYTTTHQMQVLQLPQRA